jgi:hypothetical protein
MAMDTCDKIKQTIEFSSFNGRQLATQLRAVPQVYPEALIADRIYELDVRDLDESTTTRLIRGLVNNGLAVERVAIHGGTVSHLRIWRLGEQSTFSKQFDFVIQQLAGGFEFVDGWQWSGDDPRDLIFEEPRRLDDQRTWVVGARYGILEGGPHGHWNRGTFVVQFAAPYSTEVADIGIFIRNGATVHKLAPGRSFEQVTEAPVTLL